jgi:hypothetical protein
LRDHSIISQWWCTWLAACALCLGACGREAGTFSVSFGFAGEAPDPATEYTVFVRVKDEHWTTVAESARAVFDLQATPGMAYDPVRKQTVLFGGAPGVALERWNGLTFERVQENEASLDAPGELCFESHDPDVLGALEVGKRWPFVLRPAADSDGPEPPQLRTDAFEVRVRFHLRGAEPALPPAPGARGKRCTPDGWAMRDAQHAEAGR